MRSIVPNVWLLPTSFAPQRSISPVQNDQWHWSYMYLGKVLHVGNYQVKQCKASINNEVNSVTATSSAPPPPPQDLSGLVERTPQHETRLLYLRFFNILMSKKKLGAAESKVRTVCLFVPKARYVQFVWVAACVHVCMRVCHWGDDDWTSYTDAASGGSEESTMEHWSVTDK